MVFRFVYGRRLGLPACVDGFALGEHMAGRQEPECSARYELPLDHRSSSGGLFGVPLGAARSAGAGSAREARIQD